MRTIRRVGPLAVAVLSWSACGGDAAVSTPTSGAEQPLSAAAFCERWAEMGALQQAGDTTAAAIELARLSEREPAAVSQPIEALYRLLEDRLAGKDVDFDVMLDASLAVDDYCAG